MRRPVGQIPKFISAGSPKGLQRLMLRTQAKLGYGVNFFDIQKVGAKWFAWYYDSDDFTVNNIEARLGANSERDQ